MHIGMHIGMHSVYCGYRFYSGRYNIAIWCWNLSICAQLEDLPIFQLSTVLDLGDWIELMMQFWSKSATKHTRLYVITTGHPAKLQCVWETLSDDRFALEWLSVFPSGPKRSCWSLKEQKAKLQHQQRLKPQTTRISYSWFMYSIFAKSSQLPWATFLLYKQKLATLLSKYLQPCPVWLWQLVKTLLHVCLRACLCELSAVLKWDLEQLLL